MKKALRTILSVLAGLLSAGGIALYFIINNLYADAEKGPPLLTAFKLGEQPVLITYAHGGIILAVIMLAVAALLWPRQSAEEAAAAEKQKRAEAKKKGPGKTAGAAVKAHKKASEEPDFHTPEKGAKEAAPEPAQHSAINPKTSNLKPGSFKIPDSMKVGSAKDKDEAKPAAAATAPAPKPAASSLAATQVQKSDAVSLATPEEREEAMGRLVAIGQRSLTREVADQLFQGFFPEIRTIISRVPDNCSGTVEILARQALNLMRFKIKIKDPNLATDQFATFQKKIFEMEKEHVAHMYKPRTPATCRRSSRSTSAAWCPTTTGTASSASCSASARTGPAFPSRTPPNI